MIGKSWLLGGSAVGPSPPCSRCSTVPKCWRKAPAIGVHIVFRRGRGGMSRPVSERVRSVRDDASPEQSKGDDGEGKLKVLDMGEYFSGDAGKVATFCQRLRDQCHSVGFFYVKNHGVPQDLCDSLLEMGRKFFDLPSELKMELDYKKSAQFRGYMQIGSENTAGVSDFREQLDFGPEEAEDVEIVDGKENRLVYPLYRRLRGSNQWPSGDVLQEFRPRVEDFVKEMNTFSMHLMQALALSLGLRKDYFDSAFQHMPHFQMKVARYPPKPEGNDPDSVGMFGVGPHTDSGFLSLLLQDDIGGLQAQTIAGRWTDVAPVRQTFVVNLGEMLQLATGGYYLATVHRVVSQNGSKESRYSIPFFFNPSLDTDISTFGVVDNAVEESGNYNSFSLSVESSQKKTLAVGGLSTHGGTNKLLPVFGQNAFKSFARSHVEVVRRHHPDLLDADGAVLLSKLESPSVLHDPSCG